MGADYVGRAGKAAGGKGGERLRKKSTVGGKGRRGGDKRLCWAVTTSSEKIKMIMSPRHTRAHCTKRTFMETEILTVAPGQRLEARHWFAGVVTHTHCHLLPPSSFRAPTENMTKQKIRRIN